MSDEDEERFEMYGTLLEKYDEDTIPKKKAFSIEDQVATDEHGRRRFHGAFTGGFSAGFFNTVGSLEGWKPSEFKSSRAEKADKKLQKPEDFMDAEDTSAFGIAPKLVKATSDYSNLSKRKRTTNVEGSIPGDPVLYSILQPAKDTVGVRLLKKMGWKPGQGVGPRVTKSEKLKTRRAHKKNNEKIYGCEIPEQFRRNVTYETDTSSDEDLEVTFAPDDYDAFVYKPKDNTFGIGYSGLNKMAAHISLFEPPEFRMQDRNNQKVSISGKAFGVGAFEEEDEDIYSKDDMSKYDFSLEAFSSKKKPPKKNQTPSIMDNVLEGFVPAKSKVVQKKPYPPPILPKGFVAKHGVRISRFEPLPDSHKFHNYDRAKVIGRHDLTATQRSKILNTEHKITDSTQIADKTPLKSAEDEKKTTLQQAKKITENLPNTSSGFKPFLSDPDKQKRFETFLSLSKTNPDSFSDHQLPSMSSWEKEHERNEFEQAARLYKPVQGLIFDRFVSSSNAGEDLDPLKPVSRSVYEHGTPEMQEAAKRKMFGPLTRVALPWKPHKLLCRRFNVPEPNVSDDVTMSSKRRNKFNIFDYYEAYQQNKNVGPSPSPKVKESDKIEKEKIDTSAKASSSMDKISDEAKNEDKNNKDKLIEENKEIAIESTSNQEEMEISSPTKSITDKSNEFQEIPSRSYMDTDNSEPVFQTKFKSNASTIKFGLRFTRNEPVIPITPTEPEKHERIYKPEPDLMVVATDPAAKKDLFKAIFLSDSESDSDENEVEKEDKLTEMKKVILKETVPVEPKLKIEAEPIKKPLPPSNGFFADLDLAKLSKPVENKVDDNLYGPKLPTRVDNSETWRPTFNKISERKSKVETNDNEWIELESDKESKHKSHKKHKKHKEKEKEKHKKHKSKHKKKKKSH